MKEVLRMSNKTRNKVLVGFTVVAVAAAFLTNGNTIKPKTNAQLARVSVMVTNLEGNSGGSGVILTSSDSGSTVLTNRHVCHLAQHGAKLTTSTKTAYVTSYKQSEIHDLCLITTSSNLGVNTVIAESAPNPEDEAIISGHPQLFPLVITKGHFTSHIIVSVMTGFRQCTAEEQGSELGIICALAGGLPVIKQYDALIATGTIMAGSSGSPVFNDRGEVSALVFAGQQGLSYALVVGQEYIKNFVQNEIKDLPRLYPNMEVDITGLINRSNKTRFTMILNECKKAPLSNLVNNLCNSLENSAVN